MLSYGAHAMQFFLEAHLRLLQALPLLHIFITTDPASPKGFVKRRLRLRLTTFLILIDLVPSS